MPARPPLATPASTLVSAVLPSIPRPRCSLLLTHKPSPTLLVALSPACCFGTHRHTGTGGAGRMGGPQCGRQIGWGAHRCMWPGRRAMTSPQCSCCVPTQPSRPLATCLHERRLTWHETGATHGLAWCDTTAPPPPSVLCVPAPLTACARVSPGAPPSRPTSPHPRPPSLHVFPYTPQLLGGDALECGSRCTGNSTAGAHAARATEVAPQYEERGVDAKGVAGATHEADKSQAGARRRGGSSEGDDGHGGWGTASLRGVEPSQSQPVRPPPMPLTSLRGAGCWREGEVVLCAHLMPHHAPSTCGRPTPPPRARRSAT